MLAVVILCVLVVALLRKALCGRHRIMFPMYVPVCAQRDCLSRFGISHEIYLKFRKSRNSGERSTLGFMTKSCKYSWYICRVLSRDLVFRCNYRSVQVRVKPPPRHTKGTQKVAVSDVCQVETSGSVTLTQCLGAGTNRSKHQFFRGTYPHENVILRALGKPRQRRVRRVLGKARMQRV